MGSMTQAQRSVLPVTVTGLAWLILGLASVATPDPSHYLDLLMFAPLIASVAGFTGLYRLHSGATGRLATIGLVAAVVGLVVLAVGQAGIYLESSRLKSTFLAPGFVFWIGGSIAFGIAMARSGVLPRRYGLLLAFAEGLTVLTGLALSPISPLSSWGDYSGAVCQGIIWLAIARQVAALAPRERRAGVPSAEAAGLAVD